MHLSGFHGHNPLKTSNWDSLEKALTIFILPESSPFHTGRRRRLDLIFAQPEVYWCAVVGWSVLMAIQDLNHGTTNGDGESQERICHVPA